MTDFPIPTGVHTSVTYPELRLLQRYAHEAGTVLEIGTHFGFTCIGMALAGAHVTSVDPHYEGPADRPDTWGPFGANVERHGFPPTRIFPSDWQAWVRPNSERYEMAIVGWRETIEDWEAADHLYRNEFGLVFIDGNHTWPCPMRDSQIARSHLRAPGYLAFHDVTPNWLGVWRTAEELTRSGELVKLDQVGTLAVYQVRKYVAVPSRP